MERFGYVGRVICCSEERSFEFGERAKVELGGAVGPREAPCMGSFEA